MSTKTEKKTNLEIHKSQFQGCGKRKEMMETVIQLCRENLPQPKEDFIMFLAYKLSLTRRKVSEDYIDLLLSKQVNILQMNKGKLELGNGEKDL